MPGRRAFEQEYGALAGLHPGQAGNFKGDSPDRSSLDVEVQRARDCSLERFLDAQRDVRNDDSDRRYRLTSNVAETAATDATTTRSAPLMRSGMPIGSACAGPAGRAPMKAAVSANAKDFMTSLQKNVRGGSREPPRSYETGDDAMTRGKSRSSSYTTRNSLDDFRCETRVVSGLKRGVRQIVSRGSQVWWARRSRCWSPAAQNAGMTGTCPCDVGEAWTVSRAGRRRPWVFRRRLSASAGRH